MITVRTHFSVKGSHQTENKDKPNENRIESMNWDTAESGRMCMRRVLWPQRRLNTRKIINQKLNIYKEIGKNTPLFSSHYI